MRSSSGGARPEMIAEPTIEARRPSRTDESCAEPLPTRPDAKRPGFPNCWMTPSSDRGSFLACSRWRLGAAHAIQPGHGKTLVTAVALGPQARLYQPVLLGLATTLTHMGSVLLVALALWFTGATQVESVHMGLARSAGFVIAAAGFWRIGRYVGRVR